MEDRLLYKTYVVANTSVGFVGLVLESESAISSVADLIYLEGDKSPLRSELDEEVRDEAFINVVNYKPLNDKPKHFQAPVYLIYYRIRDDEMVYKIELLLSFEELNALNVGDFIGDVTRYIEGETGYEGVVITDWVYLRNEEESDG